MVVCGELLPEALCGGPWAGGVVMDHFVKSERAVMGDYVRQSCGELVQCAGEM